MLPSAQTRVVQTQVRTQSLLAFEVLMHPDVDSFSDKHKPGMKTVSTRWKFLVRNARNFMFLRMCRRYPNMLFQCFFKYIIPQ